VDVKPGGSGAVHVEQTVPSSYPFTSDFDSGTTISIEAVPASGYSFDRWSGDLSGSDNPASLVMTCDKKVTASFSQIMHTMTIEVGGQGATTPAVGTHDYGEGTEVTITALPEDGWQFDKWSGDVADPDSATTIVTIGPDKTFTAQFSQIQPSEPSWWLILVVVAGVMIAGVVVRLLIRRRMA